MDQIKQTLCGKPRVPDLFSFGIVCYRNWEYMKETIDSVLMQDYEKIQLIVSDDGSDNFPMAEFEEYIEKNKRDNLASYIVRHSEKNEGTVRHLNHVLEVAEGEYLMLMAADDALESFDVLSKYVQAFRKQGDDCGVLFAQTALYDVTLTKVMGYYVWTNVISAINNKDDRRPLLQELYYLPCLPTTSTCFRGRILDAFGPFDTDYALIEDYPFHIKLAEANVPIHYENFVAAKHRDGGISHGAVKALSRSKQMYIEDCLRARKDVLEKAVKGNYPLNVIGFNQFQIRSNEHALYTTGKGLKGRLRYAIRHPADFLLRISNKANKKRIPVWISLMLFCVLLWQVIPEIVPYQFHILPDCFLTVLFLTCSAVLAIFVLVECVLCHIKSLTSFPY